jgi:ABC-type glycerol-3-phosphate transport system substrate-binding protein
MDIWNELQKLGQNVLASGVTTMSDATAISLFASQKAGMYAVGSWGAQTLEAPVGGVTSSTVSSNGSETVLSSTQSGTSGFTYAFTPWGYFTPGFASDAGPNTSVRIVTFPTPYFVHYKTKYPALCADFLDSMLSSQIQEVYFTQFGDFPIIPLGTAITPDKYLQQSLTWSNQLAGRPSLAATVDTALHDPIENAIGAILSGQQTPSAAAQSVEQLAIQLNQTGPTATSSSGSGGSSTASSGGSSSSSSTSTSTSSSGS